MPDRHGKCCGHQYHLLSFSLFVNGHSFNPSNVSRNIRTYLVDGPGWFGKTLKCIKYFTKDSCSGHITFFCLTRISSLCMLANKIDYFITFFSLRLILIQGGRCLQEVILLILNGLIERSEQIIKKAHKVNQSVILNKNAFNCSVQLL
jgi:hypothetical protein